MRNFLTESACAPLITQHKKERDGRVHDRIKAVLLYNEGWTLGELLASKGTSFQA